MFLFSSKFNSSYFFSRLFFWRLETSQIFTVLTSEVSTPTLKLSSVLGSSKFEVVLMLKMTFIASSLAAPTNSFNGWIQYSSVTSLSQPTTPTGATLRKPDSATRSNRLTSYPNMNSTTFQSISLLETSPISKTFFHKYLTFISWHSAIRNITERDGKLYH